MQAFLRLLSFFLLATTVANAAILSSSNDLDNDYDYVIVGGGAAGSAVAGRLSEDSHIKVLVIEAGPPQSDFIETYIPFNCSTNLQPNKPFNWNFTTAPQTGLDGRPIAYTRGRALGGSSVINYMQATRGASDDWDRWAEYTGDEGWSWDNILPYFKKSEAWTEPNDDHATSGEYDPSVHGNDGPIHVSLNGYPSGIDEMVINATEQLKDKFPFNLDTNSGNELGIAWTQATINKTNRSSGATGYLEDGNIARDNLHILLDTTVLRLSESNSSSEYPAFRTVEFQADGGNKSVSAKREVILSAGSLNTPQLLLLSGIGPKDELEALGIESKVDLPSVGKNLTDHPYIGNSWLVNSTDTRDPYARDASVAQPLNEAWLTGGDSKYLVDTPVTHIGFFRLPEDSDILKDHGDPSSGPNGPHYEFLISNSASPPNGSEYYIGIGTAAVSPASRGSVTLASSDPLEYPVIDPGVLSNDLDAAMMVQALKAAIEFLAAPAFERYVISPAQDLESAVGSDEGLLEYIKQHASTVNHPVSTSSMSPKGADYGVTDPDLKLKKVEGVRIVDASVFPYIPAGHTVLPTYAVAERAADLIKASQQ